MCLLIKTHLKIEKTCGISARYVEVSVSPLFYMYKFGIIAKYWNEELLLPLFLESIEKLHADKIYLCNDGSTDTSEQICQEFSKCNHNTTLIQFESPKSNYFQETEAESTKINRVLRHAYESGIDWVLCIDIDEIPSRFMEEFILTELRHTPPTSGIYFPICDLISNIDTFIVFNSTTNFSHYPSPHLKIFGKLSGYKRTVDGLNLDQGVEGGHQYLMTSAPYLHLKYLFDNRRNIRGTFATSPTNIDRSMIGKLPEQAIPPQLIKWWNSWAEPTVTW